MLTALPCRQDNYIWALSDAAGHAVIVDPGNAQPVLAAVETGLRPVAVLLTHHHDDHIGGAAELSRAFDIPVFGPLDQRIEVPHQVVKQGTLVRIDALDVEFAVLSIPGHTSSHVAFVGQGIVFAGDTLFSLGCGRLFEGTPGQMFASLERLADLPDDTQLACGHEYTVANGHFGQTLLPGDAALAAVMRRAEQARAAGRPSLPSTMGAERRANPFLRCREPEVGEAVAAALARTGRDIDASDPVAVFAALRKLKDDF